jgi:hypothetical protein
MHGCRLGIDDFYMYSQGGERGDDSGKKLKGRKPSNVYPPCRYRVAA